jgi:hypothetical protein
MKKILGIKKLFFVADWIKNVSEVEDLTLGGSQELPSIFPEI